MSVRRIATNSAGTVAIEGGFDKIDVGCAHAAFHKCAGPFPATRSQPQPKHYPISKGLSLLREPNAISPYAFYVFTSHWELTHSQCDHALALRYVPVTLDTTILTPGDNRVASRAAQLFAGELRHHLDSRNQNEITRGLIPSESTGRP